MSKKWTYHRSHSFINSKGKTTSMITQLYQIGVYAIIDGNPALQFSFTPSDIVRIEKQLKKDLSNNEISSLEFGLPITVTKNEDGLFEEVKNV